MLQVINKSVFVKFPEVEKKPWSVKKKYEPRKTIDEELTDVLCMKGEEIDNVVLKYTTMAT